MAYHLIDISSPQCSVTCRNGQLICRSANEPDRSAPMEDVGAIIVNSFSASFHNRVFLEAARHGAVIIFCEQFRPTALLLPANRATDTLLTRSQISLNSKMRKALWFKTVTAKCVNQAAFAQFLEPEESKDWMFSLALSKRIDKEAQCARNYWTILAKRLDLQQFRRNRNDGGLNNLLNYGYTVLLARLLQKMLAVGLDPTFGVGHVVRERATPLAYDLMEPFRVLVDARIIAWAEQQDCSGKEDQSSVLEVTPEYKRWIPGFMKHPIPYQKNIVAAENVMEHALRGFRSAVRAKQPGLYQPWTLENTKWDGC